ncbi:MAG: hypothetical protein U1E10_16280, partial [Bdellovibrionales bacterium]|nr:hypothetical protein [Bdellovibrionales bacterium]
MFTKFNTRYNKQISYGLAGLFASAFGFFLYWLLPVTAQTRLSSDHLRWVFSSTDREAVAGQSLSAVWLLILELTKLTGAISAGESLYPTAAALGGWLTLASIGLLFLKWRGFHWSVLLLMLSPWFFWSSVVPNGFAISSLALVAMSFLAVNRGGRLVAARSRPWTYALNVVEGFVAGITPAAWILILTLSVIPIEDTESERVKRHRWLRIGLILFGLLLHPLLATAAIEIWGPSSHSISFLPVLNSLRVLGLEEPLGAGLVFLGPVGETAIGLLGSVTVVVAILISWFGARPLRAALLGLPLVLVFVLGSPKAWRLAHPGWNSILEDVYLNVERSLDGPTIAITPLPTEESIARYVTSFLVKTKPMMVPVRPQSISEPGEKERVQASLPNYFEPASGELQPSFEEFLAKYLRPNLKNGIPFWFAVAPQEKTGLLIRFMMTGVVVQHKEGPSQFRLNREDAGRGYVRSRLHYSEGQLKRAIEVRAYEPYAYFHLAMAQEYLGAKTPTDWEKRATGEMYAALKKAPWLKEPYQKVCVEPEERPKTEVELKGNSQVTPV